MVHCVSDLLVLTIIRVLLETLPLRKPYVSVMCSRVMLFTTNRAWAGTVQSV
jgi:hypothetical protein